MTVVKIGSFLRMHPTGVQMSESSFDIRHKSRALLDGPDRAVARGMMKAVGFSDDDLKRPQVGVAHCWIGTMPCNWTHRGLAAKVMEGIRAVGGTPLEVNTIAINDGITTGSEGMKTSLVSREVIADSVELVARGHMFDALVVIAGCDKTIPAMAMALGRLNIPGLLLYSGSIHSGACHGKDGMFAERKLTIQDIYEAIGAFNAGRITEREFKDVEDHACPGAGACGGQFTANTMATAFEMLGISPMGFNGIPAPDAPKAQVAQECGRLVMYLLRHAITPRSLVTRRSFENAITGVMATGGSTNAVLHLLAMAREFGVALAIDDFDGISRRTPVLADLRPWGSYTAPEMHDAGGMPVVGKRLAQAGLLHGGERTVTGRTVGDEIARAAEPKGQCVIRPLSNPLKPQGGPWNPARQFGPRRLRHQAVRPGKGRASRSRPRVRARGGCVPGDQGRRDPAKRRVGAAQRGAQGRPRHARDAVGDRCAARLRPRRDRSTGD